MGRLTWKSTFKFLLFKWNSTADDSVKWTKALATELAYLNTRVVFVSNIFNFLGQYRQLCKLVSTQGPWLWELRTHIDVY